MRTTEQISTLENHGVQRYQSRRPVQVQVISGRAYVTQEGDTADYVLESGESVSVDRRGNIVVQGLPFAQYRVLAR
ncbi:MAG: hypothetical protein BGO01_03820 [Armatimonadetes bacterium 55-13]|nr:DUF2917 domain-containing protein [Armatimonadota bacterium]OJU63279.1 MAG: hypothetical protein BGO01_03820 [Armatimonadetes bacterium 55-13]